MHSDDSSPIRSSADPWAAHLETETRTGSGIDEPGWVAPVPALTVQWHPNPAAVGARILLPELASGRGIELSRISPSFEQPRGGWERPLADPRISRKPILLKHPGGATRARNPTTPETGSTPASENARASPEDLHALIIDASATSTRLEVDGQGLDGELGITIGQLERGLTLTLAGRVVLLLHTSALILRWPPGMGFVGESQAMVDLRRQMQRVAGLEVPVLILGESGTGKELVAGALKGHSRRRSAPFLTVNMGAIPASLGAAELFGAAKGAFSGADQRREGFFQRADGGTLFLDEIGEAPPEIQVLLLRALESGEVQPVGAGRATRVDVRVIAATDAELDSAVDDGKFKAPLLHRLGGYVIRVPPLRHRRDDVGRLFLHFLRQELEEVDEAHRLVDPGPLGRPWVPAELVARLVRFAWPGNVRQLRNVVRQMVVASRGETALTADPQILELLSAPDATPGVGGRGMGGSGSPCPPTESRDHPVPLVGKASGKGRRRPPKAYRDPSGVSDQELVEALAQNGWRPASAADFLGVSRPSLYVLMERCPLVRKASELQREEIEAALADSAGDLDLMVEALQVSKQGLKRRMGDLGLR